MFKQFIYTFFTYIYIIWMDFWKVLMNYYTVHDERLWHFMRSYCFTCWSFCGMNERTKALPSFTFNATNMTLFPNSLEWLYYAINVLAYTLSTTPFFSIAVIVVIISKARKIY